MKLISSVPSKKRSHWANVWFSVHAIAQPCKHTYSGVTRVTYTILNWEFCKCPRMRFRCANGLVELCICAVAHLRGNTVYKQDTNSACVVCCCFAILDAARGGRRLIKNHGHRARILSQRALKALHRKNCLLSFLTSETIVQSINSKVESCPRKLLPVQNNPTFLGIYHS